MVPWTYHYHVEQCFTLTPLELPSDEQLLQNAQALKEKNLEPVNKYAGAADACQHNPTASGRSPIDHAVLAPHAAPTTPAPAATSPAGAR